MATNKEILLKFIDSQSQRIQNDISTQGYKDNSPYRNNPSNDIYGTRQGTPITMKGVSTPLIGIDNFGNKQYMQPGQEYEFPGSKVTEIPIAQNGGSGMMYADRDYQVGGEKKPIYVESYNDPRYKTYQDSLNLYKAYNFQKNNTIKSKEELDLLKKYGQLDNWKKNIGKKGPLNKNGYENPQKDKTYDPIDPKINDLKQIEYYKSLDLDKNYRIGKYSSPDLWHKNIKPIGSYYDGIAYSPIYKKPQQPIIVKNNNNTQPLKFDPVKNQYYIEGTIIQNKQPIQAIQNNIQPLGIQSNFNLEAQLPQIRQQVVQPKYYDIQENINQPFGGHQTNYQVPNLSNITSPDDLGPDNTRTITPHYQVGGESNYTTSGEPLTILSQGSYPLTYRDRGDRDTDGTLFSASKKVSRVNDQGTPLTRNQVAENQTMWNYQKQAYGPAQQAFNNWKNNEVNTNQGYFIPSEYDNIVSKLNALPDVSSYDNNDPNFSHTKCGISKAAAKEEKQQWNKRKEGGVINYQVGGVKYGTPEYREAYNRGEVVTDQGVHSPIALNEVTVEKKSPKPGFWKQSIDEYNKEHADDGLFGALGSVVTYPLGLAQQTMMYGLTGKVQKPSAAMNNQQMYNPTNPFSMLPKGVQDTVVNTTLDPALLLTEVEKAPELLSSGLKALGTEEGLLSNFHKLNPWAFKPNPEAYYRGIGKEGLKDAIESNSLRVNQNPEWINALSGEKPDISKSSPYFFKGDNFNGVKEYNSDVIAEITNQKMKSRGISNLMNLLSDTPVTSIYQPVKTVGETGKGLFKTTIVEKMNNIPLDKNIRFLEKDWLQGYKPIEVPKSNLNYSGIFDEEGISDFMQILKNKKQADNAIGMIKADLSDPETIRRASELGIDPELLQQAFNNMTYTTQTSAPSSFNSGDFTININPKQIGRSHKQEMMAEIMRDLSPNFTANEIASHEVGHVFQNTPLWKEGYKKTVPNDIKKLLSFDTAEEAKKLRGYWENYSTRDAAPTKVDELLGDIDFKESIDKNSYANKNREYFKNANNKYGTNVDNKIERLPMFREYRQGMRDSGILKNKWDEITPEMIDEYARLKPENRINSFMDFNDKNKELLRQVSRIAPATIPIAGASYLATQGQEQNPQYQSGGIIQDNRGQKKKSSNWLLS